MNSSEKTITMHDQRKAGLEMELNKGKSKKAESEDSFEESSDEEVSEDFSLKQVKEHKKEVREEEGKESDVADSYEEEEERTKDSHETTKEEENASDDRKKFNGEDEAEKQDGEGEPKVVQVASTELRTKIKNDKNVNKYQIRDTRIIEVTNFKTNEQEEGEEAADYISDSISGEQQPKSRKRPRESASVDKRKHVAVAVESEEGHAVNGCKKKGRRRAKRRGIRAMKDYADLALHNSLDQASLVRCMIQYREEKGCPDPQNDIQSFCEFIKSNGYDVSPKQLSDMIRSSHRKYSNLKGKETIHQDEFYQLLNKFWGELLPKKKTASASASAPAAAAAINLDREADSMFWFFRESGGFIDKYHFRQVWMAAGEKERGTLRERRVKLISELARFKAEQFKLAQDLAQLIVITASSR